MLKASDDPDTILDLALATYGDPPDSIDPEMLAARVISIDQPVEHRRLWRWGLGVPVATLAGLLIFVVTPDREPKISKAHFPSQPMQTSRITSQQILLVPQTARSTLHSSHPDKSSHRPPKLDRFPTPEPPSNQERLLVLFVNRTSLETQQAVAQDSEPPQPLKINPLTVPLIDQTTKEIQSLGEQNEDDQ